MSKQSLISIIKLQKLQITINMKYIFSFIFILSIFFILNILRNANNYKTANKIIQTFFQLKNHCHCHLNNNGILNNKKQSINRNWQAQISISVQNLSCLIKIIFYKIRVQQIQYKTLSNFKKSPQAIIMSGNKYSFFSIVFLFQFFIIAKNTIYSPQWLTNNYVRSGNHDIFTTLTGSGIVHFYSFTFSSNFSGIPHLGYGIKAYQGNDFLAEERFEIKRINLTESTLTISVEMIGFTLLHFFNVPYIAIDPQFPYHLNSFDNVPINYNAGPLVNVSVRSALRKTYYWNRINYTQQAISTPYRYFSAPLSNNKVVLLMTCMVIFGTNQANGSLGSNPVDLRINTQIISNQTYKINISLSIRIKIERLEYSMIIFDQSHIEESLQSYLHYQRIDFSDQGGFLPLPVQFVDNFIMGFTQFSTNRTVTAIHFQWDFTTINGTHGVLMPVSIGKSPTQAVITRVGFTVLYMKTWLCPVDTFLDLTDNLCKSCPIQGCLTCLSYKICSVCDASNHYKLQGKICTRCEVDNNFYLNQNTGQCQFCPQFLCPKPKIEKGLCNSLIIMISATNQIPIQYDPSKIVIQNQLIYYNYSQKSADGTQIKIYASYQRDIPSSQFLIVYLGPNDKRAIKCDTSVPLMLYSQNECKSEDNTINTMYFVLITSYIVMFFSLITGKIVGLELFGVLQLAYFSLGSYQYLNIYNSPFAILKVTNGFNYNQILPNVPPSKILGYLQISNTFLNNFNVMLILPIILIIICLILYFFAYCTHNKAFKQKVVQIFKKGSITLTMFNVFNFCYSLGIHSRYGMEGLDTVQKVFSILVIGLGLIIFIWFVMMMEFSEPSQYGEFKDKFKNSFVCLIYILVSVLYRAVIVLYLSTNIEYQYSTLLVLAVAIAYIMYFLVNLPFADYYQNYRAALCHLTQLITLLAANYYRSMKSNTPIQIKTRLYDFSLLVIVMIVLCLLLSIVILTVEIVNFLKQKFPKNKSKVCAQVKSQIKDQKSNIKQTQTSFIEGSSDKTLIQPQKP